MQRERRPIPPHLLEFVVEQDYAQYSAVDQAVWRFVLLQLATRLHGTAHPAYRDGLALTGISVDHIPRIGEMNAKLERFGWGAVCVDGFIPPRAFQEFQAAGYLPIAADMRTLPHLVYTPAPDIIHEAAGHAPILSDPEYAVYIEQSGQVGARAFTLPADDVVYRAIYVLSEVKENPEATPEQLRRAELALERAIAESSELSEASRLARLYWWTAEYGLVGTPDDYRLYGAGLLSSLWESYACHSASVAKLPLSAACVDVSYDITRPQPQLFVARDFAHLREVLAEAERGLAFHIGGNLALDWAQRSAALSTLMFDRGLEAIGVLDEVRSLAGTALLLRLSGSVAFAQRGSLLPGVRHEDGHWVVLGLPEGEGSTRQKAERLLERPDALATPIRWRSGVQLSGSAAEPVRSASGELVALRFAAATLIDPTRGEVHEGPFTWLLVESFETARAGASDPAYHPATRRSTIRVPKPHRLPEREARLLELYEQASSALRGAFGARAQSELERIHDTLRRDFPDEWLLRWNLLESLLKLGSEAPLSAMLKAELEALEIRYEHREPITSGLRYLESELS